MKKIYLLIFIFIIIQNKIYSQTYISLEKSLSSVVTVGVTDEQGLKIMLGYRGGELPIDEIAYSKALDMTGIKSSGSGFIIEKNGKKYVITNAHVIENASETDSSIVIFSISQEKYYVKVVGGDSFYDIAVLEFVDTPGNEIAVAKFRNTPVHIGDKVFAIGNPLGEFPYTVTDGIISAKNRIREGLTGKFGFLQTTATGIWGNSGGPLVDENGLVVGIVSQTEFTQKDNHLIWQSQINFALDGVLSQRLIDDIIVNKGIIKRAFIGIELSQKYKSKNGLQYKINEKPIISGVLPEAVAFDTLRHYIGWELSRINDISIRNLEEALFEFELLKQNSEVELTVSSGKFTRKIIIKTKTLGTKELEAIAKFVIFNTKEIYLEKSYDPLFGLLIKGGSRLYYYKNNDDLKNTLNLTSKNFFIISAGPQYDNQWITTTLSQFGAAIKTASLTGTLDFYALPYGSQNVEDIMVFKIDLSDDDISIQKKIFY